MDNFKILLCGDVAVGKTSLRRRYLGYGFKEDYIATMGVDFALAEVKVSNGQMYSLTIWDIAGQERFERFRPSFYEGASGAFILYDIIRPKTFENVLNWVEDLLKYQNIDNFPIVLVANKIDLREGIGVLSTSEGEELAKKIAMKYYNDNWTVPLIETSAKTGKNVKKAFITITDSIVKLQKKKQS